MSWHGSKNINETTAFEHVMRHDFLWVAAVHQSTFNICVVECIYLCITVWTVKTPTKVHISKVLLVRFSKNSSLSQFFTHLSNFFYLLIFGPALVSKLKQNFEFFIIQKFRNSPEVLGYRILSYSPLSCILNISS